MYITLLSVISVGLLSLLLTLHIIKRYDHFLYTTSAQSLDQVTANIESELDAIAMLSDHLLSNPTIQSSLMTLNDAGDSISYTRAKKTAYDSIYYYLFANKNINSVTLVIDDTIINIGDTLSLSSATLEHLGTTALSQNGNYDWVAGELSEGQVICVREIRQKAYVSLRHLATLYICVDIDAIVSRSLSNQADKNFNFILFSGDSVITPTDSPYADASLQHLSTTESYMIQTVQNKKKFVVQGLLPNVKWRYLYFIDYDTIFQGIQTMKLQSAFIIIAVIVITLCLTNVLIKKILRYFQVLVTKMKHFQNGNLEPLLDTLNSFEEMDELGELNRKFDEMVISFNKLINDNYIKQLYLKDAQIKMLQQQINPHFLYNTLDSINWMAQNRGSDDIATMARSLGNLFRGTISQIDDFLPLSKELDFLQNYILIQSFRFKERLNFELQISEAYNALLVPKMIIQPLVENAIKHGVEDSFDPCTIRLTLDEYPDCYKIKVSNTCSVFEADLLQKIERNELVPGGTGVGLINIDTRLKLIFGERFGLSFYNENQMAVAVVTIPNDRND
jgi:two-component system sensor histidine kinase YesM